MHKPLLVYLISLIWIVFVSGEEWNNQIQLSNLQRTIDLSTQNPRHKVKFELSNTGSNDVTTFHLAIEEESAKHLAFLEVQQDTSFLESTKIKTVQSKGDKKGYDLYEIKLASQIAGGKKASLSLKLVFTHSIQLYPRSITQSESQFVVYSGNHFFFSPYLVQSQSTTVKLSSTKIISKTEKSPTSSKGDMINYGPYDDVPPFSFSEMRLHYENNKPIITVTSLIKEIEISHWGNVAVEETYELQHDGAKLKGTFSRLDYQRNPRGSPSVVASLKQTLPPGATDVYYRDEIGNITTSHLAGLKRAPTLDLIPRYPLFGGWKAAFYMGYNLPVHRYLFNDVNDNSLHLLNITFAVSYDDVVVDRLIVRVILPEGSSDIEYHTPFPVTFKGIAVHKTYLDTKGRPVLVLEKENIVLEHNQYFQVSYRFSKLSLFQEPFLIIIAFFLFLLFVMVYVRLTSSSGNVEEIDRLLGEFRNLMENREEIYVKLEESLSKYLTSKNNSIWNNEKNIAHESLRRIKEKVEVVKRGLENLNSPLANLVAQIEKKVENKTILQFAIQNNEAESLNPNKKQSVAQTREKLNNQLNSLNQELNQLLTELFD